MDDILRIDLIVAIWSKEIYIPRRSRRTIQTHNLSKENHFSLLFAFTINAIKAKDGTRRDKPLLQVGFIHPAVVLEQVYPAELHLSTHFCNVDIGTSCTLGESVEEETLGRVVEKLGLMGCVG